MRTYILLGVLMLWTVYSWACSCLLTSFCENAGSSFAVAVVQVENIFSENGMKVRVEEKWSGNELPETITVWGDLTGLTCGPYVGGYEAGTRLILALYQLDPEIVVSPPVESGDYFLPICSNAILEIKDNQVEGYITSNENIESIRVSRLRKKLDDCAFPTVLFDATQEGLNIRLLSDNSSNGQPNRKEIHVLDLQGRLIRKQSYELDATDLSLETRDLPSGMYVIRLYLGNKEKAFKGILGNSL
ncbi:MAG: T9SS type A sorting domain-containing protein [Bacteroidota bacterium]